MALILSGDTGPSFVQDAAMPAGAVLQVVQTVKSDAFTSAAGSAVWVDITGLSASITPISSSSKIMVFLTAIGGTNNLSYIRIVRDSTVIGTGDASGSRIRATTGNFSDNTDGNRSFSFTAMYLDSPATTSSTTYKLQVANETTNTFYLNRTRSDADSAVGMRTISHITLMEIAG